MEKTDFTDVTEMAGEKISTEQVFRLANRYYWAGTFAQGRDVLEVACGTGPGLGYLSTISNSITAGDYSQAIVDAAKSHYGDRITISQFDAQDLPYQDNSLDVIIIFEALYYIPSAEKFASECKRVLRSGGYVLVSNANKDLFDFNPSPHSFIYHGVKELGQLFNNLEFDTQFWGSTPVAQISWKQKILRPIKKIIVNSGLMPKSMAGKAFFKRLIFGSLVEMPAEIDENTSAVEKPQEIRSGIKNTDYKVIYCAARLR
jgi:ubiquinone/menaquinone biosynthesis C-methylase UbiE